MTPEEFDAFCAEGHPLFQALVETVKVAGAPVICETSDDGRKDDIAWLRDRVT